MSSPSAPQSVMDGLRVTLVNGKGEKVFDSNDKIPKIGFPTQPLKYCPNCGGETQPIVYMCKCCGVRYIQQEDKKTGRVIVVALGLNEEDF